MRWIFWIGLALLVTLSALPLLGEEGSGLNFAILAPLIVAIVWGVTLLMLSSLQLKERLYALPRFLRQKPVLWWLLILAAILAGVAWWGLLKHTFERKNFYLWLYFWGALLLFIGGLSSGELREMGRKLGAGRWTGLLITLTTLVLLLTGIEIGMRVWMVMSDGYGFTIMNARWFNTYWKPINQQGFRDYPIRQNVDESVQRIIVVGDSFASGHGINDIDDTFPQLMAQELGEGYTVNIAAKPGWNTKNQQDALKELPLEPDVVILSYFLNDIDHLMLATYDADFAKIYPLPPQPWDTLVLNFYLPNFLYWHVWGQMIRQGTENYIDFVFSPYKTPDLWQKQEEWLQGFIDYADEHEARLIVLIWPSLDSLEASAGPVAQVAEFFISREVTVVNMLDDLAGRSRAEIVVNPFDAHPNEAIHLLAAQKLLDVLRADP